MEDYDIDQDEIFEIYEILDRTCQRLAKDIIAEVQAMRNSQPVDTGASSPNKRSLSRSPSKPLLRDPSASLTKTPTHKRKAVFPVDQPDDNPMQVDETPVKRPRTSPRKSKEDLDRNAFSAFQAAMCTPSRPHGGLTSALEASSSRLTLDLLNSAAQGDSDNEEAAAAMEDDELPGAVSVPTTDVEMADDTEGDEPAVVAAQAEPKTPRKHDRIPRPVFHGALQTPKTPRTAKGSPLKTSPKKAKGREYVEVEEEPRRRNRPVLLSHWQWFRPDVRVVPTAA